MCLFATYGKFPCGATQFSAYSACERGIESLSDANLALFCGVPALYFYFEMRLNAKIRNVSKPIRRDAMGSQGA